MFTFIEYKNNLFSDLDNVPTTIVVTDTNTIWVTSIKICNRGAAPININLKQFRDRLLNPITSFCLNEFEIKPYDTVDLLEKIGLIQLEYSTASYHDSLICYSNGYTQKFDCNVVYAKLKELPVI